MRIAKLLLSFTPVLSFAPALSVRCDAASKAELNAKTLAGEPVRLKDLRGKLVVLNFWATWCVPCRDEMPLLVKTARANTVPDLLFIAASLDDASTRKNLPDSVQRYDIPFAVWMGVGGDSLFKLSKGEAVPATVFIDRDGSIEAQVSGQITERELSERIAWLTGPRTGAKPTPFVSHIP